MRIGFPRMTPLQAYRSHKPGDSATGGVEALPLQLPPDLTHAIDLEVLIEHPSYLDLQTDIAAGANRQAVHTKRLATFS